MKSSGVASWVWRVALAARVLAAGPGYAKNAKDDVYRSVKLFTDVVSIVRENYVGKVESNELIQGAINGMLQTLDPHSSLLTPEDFQEMRTDTRGEFGGIGVEITVRDNMLTVVTPIEGTPADQACSPKQPFSYAPPKKMRQPCGCPGFLFCHRNNNTGIYYIPVYYCLLLSALP